MKFGEIKDLTVEELRKRLKKNKEDMFELKMKHSLGQIANPIEVRDARKDVARIQTALHQKLAR